jgi:protein SCO1/2
MSSGSPAQESTPPRTQRPAIRLALPLIVLVVILAGVTLLLVGGSSKKATLPGTAVVNTSAFAGSSITPPTPAPALDTLSNYDGTPFNLAAQRGKAVFITFLYTHCPDVCPLIAANLHNAYARMTPAMRKHVAIVSVSVDPHGDSAGSVASFMHAHQLSGEASYLIGAPKKLAAVWSAWHVGSEKDTSRPELVNHSSLIYGISATGRIYTIYPANFEPSQIVHDVTPLLSR